MLEEERISIFIRTRRHVDKKTGCIRPEAFLPRRFQGRLQSSVYRTGGLSETDIWDICRKHYERPGFLAAGRGDGLARPVLAAGLSFDRPGEPHPRHARILGWREDGETNPRARKSEWMIAARKLAGEFELVPRPEAGP